MKIILGCSKYPLPDEAPRCHATWFILEFVKTTKWKGHGQPVSCEMICFFGIKGGMSKLTCWLWTLEVLSWGKADMEVSTISSWIWGTDGVSPRSAYPLHHFLNHQVVLSASNLVV